MSALICPLLNSECIGRNCAMAVMLDHPNISAYDVCWKCGLIHSVEVERYGQPHVIDSMSRKEWNKQRWGQG